MGFLWKLVVILILKVFVKNSVCEDTIVVSPCPDVFKYFNDGEHIYGIITIPPPRDGQWTVLNISIGSNGQTHSPARYLELFKSRDKTAKDALVGKSIQYRLLLPVREGDEIPSVKYIYLNGMTICTGRHIFYHNNWSFKHSFFFGDGSLRTEHISHAEEYFPTFYDWIFAQPNYTNFNPDSMTNLSTKEPKMKPMSMIEIPTRMAHNGLWIKDLPFKCGMKPPMEKKLVLATLILNGTPVTKGEFPWLAYLEYTNRDIICGGTLVSDRHVITAAHCVVGQPVTSVQLGKHDRFLKEAGSIRRDIRTIVVHDEYKKDEAHADIAIIFIDAVPLTHQIYPACIWPFGINLDGAFPYGMVAGWGIFRNDEFSSRTPMKTMVPIVSLEMCRQSDDHYRVLATDHTICAGGQNSGPCYGDSGSGFYLQHNTTYFLRGVVSTSLRDVTTNYCQTNHYAVYVDIAFYLDWLRPYITDIDNELVKITSRIDNRFRDPDKATIEIST